MAGHEYTSVRSPRVKAARRLAKRAFRRRERLFLAEGPQAVREALARPGTVHELYVTTGARQRHQDLIKAAGQAGIAARQVSTEVLGDLAQTVTPQGVLAICGFVDVDLAAVADIRLAVILSHVRDPGNAGTVLRTADAAGADVVVFTDASVDPYNGKCVRASAGSLFHLPVVVDRPLEDAVGHLRDRGVRILAADGTGPASLDTQIDSGGLRGPTAWVFGNEAWGLPDAAREQCDETVGVPIYGDAESLNLATAAAVCLFTTAREQRR